MAIEPGQIYRSCKPKDMGLRIRIIHVGEKSVRACLAADGQPLPVRIPIRQLHDSPITASGRSRTSGFVRVQT